MSTTKSKQRITTALVAAGLALAASPPAAGESRWYLAGMLGQASVEREFGPRILGWRVDDAASSASVEVGYALHRHLGVQAGYRDLGSYPGLDRPCPPGQVCPTTLGALPPALVPVFPTEARFRGLTLSAVPRLPLSERFSFYGKLGVLGWRGDLSSTPDGGRLDEPSDTDLLAGVGAHYVFPKGLGVLVEYEDSDLASAVSVGASWRL